MWDERYAVGHYIYGTEPNRFLQQNAAIIACGGKVLCLAEGEGRNAVFLARQGYRVTAVDASLVGLNKARMLAQDQGVTIELIHADLEEYHLGEAQWDGIVSIFCHLPAPLRRKVHRQVVSGLKPGGVLLLEAYTPAQLQHGTGGPPSESMLMQAAELADELAGLQFSRLQELERDVVEGTHHDGIGAVVQVVATRPDGPRAIDDLA